MNANLDTANYYDTALTETTASLGRRVIVNVDDLGLSEPVNQAVIDLAIKRLITATSYMVGGDIKDASIKTLHHFNIDVGLHLDFTGIFDSAVPHSLPALLKASYLRKLDAKTLTAEIKQQFDKFEDKFNQPPKFIDGHQHVHQFPIIRDCLIQELNHRYNLNHRDGQDKPKIAARVTFPLNPDLKAWIIYSLGGQKWQSLCQQARMPTNHYFAGVYNFQAKKIDYARLWLKWLSHCPMSTLNNNDPTRNPNCSQQRPVTVIMCHPARPDEKWHDEIKQAREREYQWMMSGQLKKLYDTQNVKLTHWSDI